MNPKRFRPGTGVTWPKKHARPATSLDDAGVKPYFALDNMINAMFDCTQRLFGIRFIEQTGHTLHYPDTHLWEVRSPGDAGGPVHG